MTILIIFSHPSKRSYTANVLEQLKAECIAQNWMIEVSDLYAMNFQPGMTEEEYEREVFSNAALPVSADILTEHEKIGKADCIIFVYPVWWSDCPAIMKGWFDRVYTVGYAYKHNEIMQKMKPIKYGLALCTAGYSNEYLNEAGIAQSMQKIMLDDRLGNRFMQKGMIILGGTIEIENVRNLHKEQIKAAIKKIAKYCR